MIKNNKNNGMHLDVRIEEEGIFKVAKVFGTTDLDNVEDILCSILKQLHFSSREKIVITGFTQASDNTVSFKTTINGKKTYNFSFYNNGLILKFGNASFTSTYNLLISDKKDTSLKLREYYGKLDDKNLVFISNDNGIMISITSMINNQTLNKISLSINTSRNIDNVKSLISCLNSYTYQNPITRLYQDIVILGLDGDITGVNLKLETVYNKPLLNSFKTTNIIELANGRLKTFGLCSKGGRHGCIFLGDGKVDYYTLNGSKPITSKIYDINDEIDNPRYQKILDNNINSLILMFHDDSPSFIGEKKESCIEDYGQMSFLKGKVFAK